MEKGKDRCSEFPETAGQLQVGPSHGCPSPGGPLCSAHPGVGPPGKKPQWQMGKGHLFSTWMDNHDTWGRAVRCAAAVRKQTTAHRGQGFSQAGAATGGSGTAWDAPGPPPSPSKTTKGPRRPGGVAPSRIQALHHAGKAAEVP